MTIISYHRGLKKNDLLTFSLLQQSPQPQATLCSLEEAKSLLQVTNGNSFLDLIAKQVSPQNEKMSCFPQTFFFPMCLFVCLVDWLVGWLVAFIVLFPVAVPFVCWFVNWQVSFIAVFCCI